jgi:uncharacterized protein
MPSIKDFRRAFKRAAKEFGPKRFVLAGKMISCPHCSSQRFNIGEAQLNTALATLFNLDWANESATVLICIECGQIQWFGKAPESLD